MSGSSSASAPWAPLGGNASTTPRHLDQRAVEAPAVEAPAAVKSDGAAMAAKGEPVDVGDATVTILDAKYANSVGEYQKPADGYVYFALKVRYEATDGEILVNSGDWNVLADGKKQGQWTIVINDDWDPGLTFDTLTTGATTEGWITFEVPEPTDTSASSSTTTCSVMSRSS